MLPLIALALLLCSVGLSQRLGVVGDWGYDSAHRPLVAQAMRLAHQAQPWNGLLTLGDNFYPRGEPIQQFVDDLPRVKIYPAFGNHDVPALERQLKLFGQPLPFYAVRLGDIEVFVLYSEAYTLEQHAWLEGVLAASKAPWKIITLHRPLYSSAFHGGSRSLRGRIEPLALRYGVRLILAGHEHSYERLEVKGITYIVSGGGGANLRGFWLVKPGSQARIIGPNFALLEATSERLTLSAYNEKNMLIDQAVLKR